MTKSLHIYTSSIRTFTIRIGVFDVERRRSLHFASRTKPHVIANVYKKQTPFYRGGLFFICVGNVYDSIQLQIKQNYGRVGAL